MKYFFSYGKEADEQAFERYKDVICIVLKNKQLSQFDGSIIYKVKSIGILSVIHLENLRETVNRSNEND